MDRPFLPKSTLEEDVHYHITGDGKTLELSKSLSSFGFPSRKIQSSGVIKSVTKVGLEYKVYVGDNGYYLMLDYKPEEKVGEIFSYEVNQYSFWVTDVEVDEGALWKYFGRFVRVDQATSTQLYQDYLRGLYFLYGNGPTITLLQRGLNLAIGIPFSRGEEEILDIQVDPESGNYNVITPTNSYTIPYGIPSDYAVGDILPEGVELAQVASIQDYKTKDEWWINVSVPRTIMLYDPTESTVAAIGTAAEYYMRTFLKYNTFLVNIKLVASFNNTSILEVIKLIDSAKPTYTFPIYIWQVPLIQECLGANDDELTVTPTLRLGDVLLFGEFINRSKAFLPTYEVTAYPGPTLLAIGYNYKNVGTAAITDGSTYIQPGETATAISSSVWRKPAKNGERACGRWIRSNYDITGYGGDMVSVVHSSLDAPDGIVTITVNDEDLIPLYNATQLEIQLKLQALSITFPSPLADRFVVDTLDGTDNTVYDTLFMRDSGTATGIGYNCGDISPFILEAKRYFVPDQGDLGATETIAFFRVAPGVYSVFLVKTNTLFTPVYFPPREEDPIEISIVPTVGAPSVHYSDVSF